MSDWIILEGGTQPIIENPLDGQALPTTVPLEQHKNLEGDYTRSRQDAIDLATQLVQANPKALATIKDIRIQNAVAKQVYWFDTYNQLIAVVGENFHTSADEENLDKTEKLEREVRLLRYKSESGELDNAIDSFIAQNKDVVTTPEDEAKLRAELKFISSELPAKERIRRASAIAFGTMPNTTSVYKKIAIWTSTNWGNGNMDQISQKESEIQIQIAEGRRLLGLV